MRTYAAPLEVESVRIKTNADCRVLAYEPICVGRYCLDQKGELLVRYLKEDSLKFKGQLCGSAAIARVVAVTETLCIMQSSEKLDHVRVSTGRFSDELRPDLGYACPVGRSV